jgi:hypothetical protein
VAKQKKNIEEESDAESDNGEGDEDGEGQGKVKWKTLEHHGVIFFPAYESHGVKLVHKVSLLSEIIFDMNRESK